MSARYVKTDAGREAIRTRAATLSRPARNLLLIIDGTRSGDEWLVLVGNATAADLAQLLDAGFVAEVEDVRAAPPAAAATRAMVLASVLNSALQALSYRDLYDRLTSEARARLGLIKGYRMVLEIEKCADADEIRKLALRFAEDVRTAQGDDAARDFCRSLGANV
jgi:hypothetical protein